MHFFRAWEATDGGCEARTGIAVLTVDEGFALARACWIDRKRAAEQRRARADD